MNRVSSLDASFLYMETPTMHMHVGLVLILEPSGASQGGDFSRIETIIERKARTTPQLCKRLVAVPFQLDHPLWIDDPYFDLRHHFRRISCPQPGDMAALSGLAARLISTPLDRSRPLWEVCLVEGLSEGRFAFIAKLHHAVADGMAGVALLASLFSGSPDDAPLSSELSASRAAEAAPKGHELLREALASRFKNLPELANTWKRTFDGVMKLRERWRGEHREWTKRFNAPRTRWSGSITGRRTVAFARVALTDLDAIRGKNGGSRNDVILAICSGALRRYLENLGELPPEPLIATCPISIRKRGTRDTQISAVFASLATDIADPAERLQAIRNNMQDAIAEHNAFGGNMLGIWAELVSPMILVTGARAYTKFKLADRHRPLYNVAISNVPGPRKPIYFAGAKLVAAYPTGPINEGGGINITVMTYMEHAHFGFVAATNVLPDLNRIAEGVASSTAELLAAVGGGSARSGDQA